MKEVLEKEIKAILSGFGIENPKVNFNTPTHMDMGDYSTSVAMAYAKELGKKPLDLALQIKEEIVSKKLKHISRIDVIAPGFVNFFFDVHFFAQNIGKISAKNGNLKGQKIIIEYTDQNPFKEFHIGHLMPNIIGQSITNILETLGGEVKRANYQSDVGLHVAKAVWAIKKGISLKESYAYGHKAYEENEESKKEIVDINKKIYDKSDEKINKIYQDGRRESLDHFEDVYNRLGTKFDFYFFESEVGGFGKEVVEENIGKIFEESDGAVVFKGEKFDPKLHTRVFINSQGLPTYEAKELGLSKIKYDKYPYDKSIIITGNEINEYFKVLLVAMRGVFPELAKKTIHFSHGMLRLPTGKMSSRTGNIISAESLIDQVKSKIKSRIPPEQSEGNKDKALATTDEIAEIIAIGAIKYSILRQAIGGDIIFDFDKSISFEGDSGPYLQYAIVRANSLLKKAEGVVSISDELPENWQTTNLERFLERFPDVVSRAGLEYAPHYIATYLIELAGEFNSFYASGKIIDQEDSTSAYRLALTHAFAQVMTSGLDLLGIKVPSQM